ncbi:MAG: hypothetical protein LBF21_01110 [Puniceicoccales bacterium]|nr:hypothetical protein [Puniceicoccales bacterium]
MELFEPEEISKARLERWNAFYGRRRVLKSSVAGRELWLTCLPQPGIEGECSLWSLELQGKEFRVYLSPFPVLSDLEAQFQEVSWRVLPRELQLLFWEAALSPLLNALESLLGAKISLRSVEEKVCAPEFSAETIGFRAFMPAEGRNFFGCWQVEDPALEAKLRDLWKHQPTLPLRKYEDLRVDYTLDLGSTELSREAYEKLQEEDLILLDHYALAPGTASSLRGLEPFQVQVVPCEGGFRVQKVKL